MREELRWGYMQIHQSLQKISVLFAQERKELVKVEGISITKGVGSTELFQNSWHREEISLEATELVENLYMDDILMMKTFSMIMTEKVYSRWLMLAQELMDLSFSCVLGHNHILMVLILSLEKLKKG